MSQNTSVHPLTFGLSLTPSSDSVSSQHDMITLDNSYKQHKLVSILLYIISAYVQLNAKKPNNKGKCCLKWYWMQIQVYTKSPIHLIKHMTFFL